MTKKTSLSDIAKSLGVSKTLVSLVINNKGDEHGISAETQKRVLDKIKELNYRPNVLARGFRTGRTNTIGLIVSDISNRFYSRIARRVEDYAWIHGYSVVICSTDENEEKEIQQIRLLRDRKVDGLIISSSQKDCEIFNKLVDAEMPHVLIDRTFDGMKSVNVSVDNFGGARMAARHLITQGIKKIALVTITPEHISTISDRKKGFLSALNEAKITIPPEWHIAIPFNNIEQAIKESLLKLYPVSYTHLRAHETVLDIVCRLLLEKKNDFPENISSNIQQFINTIKKINNTTNTTSSHLIKIT